MNGGRQTNDGVPASLVAWAQEADASRLDDKTVRDAEYFLKRYRWITEPGREESALRLVALIARQVSPPPPIDVAPLDIIATALAVRRQQLGYA
jgi:hypothetical protein